jgi:hypothetical protein
MDSQQLASLRDAISNIIGQAAVVVLVLPAPSDAAAPNRDPATEQAEGMTIKDYIARFAPDKEPSTIRDWCRNGEFPPTLQADGRIDPGAYRPGKEWIITYAGARARSERRRRNWLERHAHESPRAATGEDPAADPPRADDVVAEKRQDTHEKEVRNAVSRKGGKAETGERPNKGAWQKVRQIDTAA